MPEYRGPCPDCGAPVRSTGHDGDLVFDPPFTREDVEVLRSLYWARTEYANSKASSDEEYDMADRLGSLADRIEALLPPLEEPK